MISNLSLTGRHAVPVTMILQIGGKSIGWSLSKLHASLQASKALALDVMLSQEDRGQGAVQRVSSR